MHCSRLPFADLSLSRAGSIGRFRALFIATVIVRLASNLRNPDNRCRIQCTLASAPDPASDDRPPPPLPAPGSARCARRDRRSPIGSSFKLDGRSALTR